MPNIIAERFQIGKEDNRVHVDLRRSSFVHTSSPKSQIKSADLS